MAEEGDESKVLNGCGLAGINQQLDRYRCAQVTQNEQDEYSGIQKENLLVSWMGCEILAAKGP